MISVKSSARLLYLLQLSTFYRHWNQGQTVGIESRSHTNRSQSTNQCQWCLSASACWHTEFELSQINYHRCFPLHQHHISQLTLHNADVHRLVGKYETVLWLVESAAILTVVFPCSCHGPGKTSESETQNHQSVCLQIDSRQGEVRRTGIKTTCLKCSAGATKYCNDSHW